MFSRQTLAQLAVPALMLVIAAQQIVRVQTSLLNSNRGGGFGMFSTIDSSHLRFLRVEGFDAAGRSLGSCGESVIPDEVLPVLHQARWMPDEARLERLGRAVLGLPVEPSTRLERVLVNSDAKPAARSFDRACTFAARPERVRLELGSVEFDAVNHRARAYRVTAHEVQR
jgi:hypothetical protein